MKRTTTSRIRIRLLKRITSTRMARTGIEIGRIVLQTA
jgi:hypothetical protein